MMHFKLLDKQEQAKHKTRRWKEIIKIRAEINEIEIKGYTKHQKKNKRLDLQKDT
jgi:hypothetical protein